MAIVVSLFVYERNTEAEERCGGAEFFINQLVHHLNQYPKAAYVLVKLTEHFHLSVFRGF